MTIRAYMMDLADSEICKCLLVFLKKQSPIYSDMFESNHNLAALII